MAKMFTKEQVWAWLRENSLRGDKSIENAFIGKVGDVLQEALEKEITIPRIIRGMTGRIRIRAIPGMAIVRRPSGAGLAKLGWKMPVIEWATLMNQ